MNKTMGNMKNIVTGALIICLVSIVGLVGCDDKKMSPIAANEVSAETKIRQGTQVKGDTQPIGNAQFFVTYRYTDPMTGMEAFRLLIPKGWQAQGQIAWSANPALPAQARFRFWNPNGSG
ncbi:MAG: hypothetical protein WBJ54_06585, partial [Syntrophorhabdus sp.]